MKRIKGLSQIAMGLTIIGLCLHLLVVLASKTLSVLIMLVGALCIGLGFSTLGIKTPTQEGPETLTEDNRSVDRNTQKETAKTSREHAEPVGQSLTNDFSPQTILSQPVEEKEAPMRSIK